jgi:hypothetical protein
MGASDLEVAHIFRLHGADYRSRHRLTRQHLRMMRAIEICRSPALGGHVYRCEQCGQTRTIYHSCRNRHCPKCQTLDRERWLDQRRAELLPVPYFHVVFTLPEELNSIALSHPRLLYGLLFASATETLLEVAANPRHLGARIGILAVLHTWSQKLTLHPHLHCIVPGGGLSLDRTRWVGCRPNFFLPVRILSRVFRGKLLHGLRTAYETEELRGETGPLASRPAFDAFLDELYAKEWMVYSKPPFGGPDHVLGYLGRYTHRVAISNSRLVSLEGGNVSFTWKDYAHGSRTGAITLPAEEFIRRFLLHVLPEGFVRIRHYGLLSSRTRAADLTLCREFLGKAEPFAPPETCNWQALLQRLSGVDPLLCPECGGQLRLSEELAPEVSHRNRAPP